MHRRWQSVVFVLSFLLLWGFPLQLVGTNLRMSVAVAQEETRQQQETKVWLLTAEGLRLYSSGKFRQALNKFEQALVIVKEIDDRSTEGIILYAIGGAKIHLGQYQQALDYSQQALKIFQEESNRFLEATTLNNIGEVYRNQGQYQEALDYYQQSLDISRKGSGTEIAPFQNGYLWRTLLNIIQEVSDRLLEGIILSNIGQVYRSQGQYQQALGYYQQALKIFQETRNRSSEATLLNNIGAVYYDLGQYQQAESYYQQALNVVQKLRDPYREGATLSNIAAVYQSRGEYGEARNYFERALNIIQELSNPSAESAVLNNIGAAYYNLGQYQQALDYYQQALNIAQEIDARSLEGGSLNNIGSVYQRLERYQQAQSYYQQALKTIREVGDRDTEASNLSNIGALLEQKSRSELAIVLYKQSVNVFESIREGLQPIPRELQQSYTEKVAATYRRLADRLLEQDRILEAQRVLDLLKLQEIEDYNRRGIRGNDRTRTGIELLSPERQIWQGYEQILNKAVAVGTELTKIRQTPEADRTPDQNSRLSELERLEQQYQQQLNDYLDSPPVVALVQQLQRNVKEQRLDVAYFDILQKELGQLAQNGALLYPLVLDDRLELVVTTLDKEPMRRTVEVTRVELNQAIIDFRSALEDPDCEPGIEEGCIDPAIPAQKLYNWIVKPIEADLIAANVETIIYAPDQQLRYIPLAALHDGQQWLIERWQVNNITALSLTNLNKPPSQQPRVLAGAFSDTSKNYSFTVGEKPFSFKGLQFADDEVNAIKSTIPKTEILLNQDFTHKDTVTRGRENNIIHLATHAAFVQGYPHESFILFGNGDRATIRDMEQWELPGVELVVLSACETGLNGFGDGVEILGLGYMVQNAGAMAAIATLWEAWDESTQTLMKPFYQLLADSDITKAEALQQAQISLINSDKRSHPYYWAPFLLIGNGL